MIYKLGLILSLLPLAAFANEGGHGAAQGLDAHTIKTMIYQAINIAILVGALIYGLKASIKEFFKQKQASFLSTAEKAKAARVQAEEEHAQIKIQLTKLESTTHETISRARADAAQMRHQMLQEAEAMSKRIQQEAEQAAALEIAKAKASLRDQMIVQATILAEEALKQKVSTEDHKRLQGDFIRNVSEVRS